MTTRKTTFENIKKSIGHTSIHSCKKVHHRLIFVRKHYLESSDDESSMNKNIQQTKFGKIYEKDNASDSGSTSDVLRTDDNQHQFANSNQDVAPGVTHSSIVILRSPDKSTPISPLPSSSTVTLSSDSLSENEHINSSNITVGEILKENYRQKKEIEYYTSEWTPKPTGPATQVSSQFTQTDAIIPTNLMKKKSKQKQKMKQICRRLKLNISQIKKCKHTTDITKTCRSITKCLYPDHHVRATMKISKMSEEYKFDIRGNFTNYCSKQKNYFTDLECCKLLHPDQRRIKTFILNNAIGNVFASEKHKE